MKSQRRHNLKTNELADSLEQFLEFFRAHGTKLLSGVLLVVLAAVVIFVLYNNASRNRAQGWQQLSAAIRGSASVRPADLRALAERTSDPALAALAWKQLGNMLTSEYLLADETERTRLVEQAQRAYQTVLDKYPNQTLAAGGARIGLAMIDEDLGRWDQARSAYEKLKDDKSLAAMGLSQVAARRLAQLDQLQTLSPNLVTTAPATAPASQPSDDNPGEP